MGCLSGPSMYHVQKCKQCCRYVHLFVSGTAAWERRTKEGFCQLRLMSNLCIIENIKQKLLWSMLYGLMLLGYPTLQQEYLKQGLIFIFLWFSLLFTTNIIYKWEQFTLRANWKIVYTQLSTVKPNIPKLRVFFSSFSGSD